MREQPFDQSDGAEPFIFFQIIKYTCLPLLPHGFPKFVLVFFFTNAQVTRKLLQVTEKGALVAGFN